MKKTATPRLRIAIVDDHVLLREMLATLCNNWVHGEVVLKAADGVDYEEQVAKVGRLTWPLWTCGCPGAMDMRPWSGYGSTNRIRA